MHKISFFGRFIAVIGMVGLVACTTSAGDGERTAESTSAITAITSVTSSPAATTQECANDALWTDCFTCCASVAAPGESNVSIQCNSLDGTPAPGDDPRCPALTACLNTANCDGKPFFGPGFPGL
jgi:hypothetical protein